MNLYKRHILFALSSSTLSILSFILIAQTDAFLLDKTIFYILVLVLITLINLGLLYFFYIKKLTNISTLLRQQLPTTIIAQENNFNDLLNKIEKKIEVLISERNKEIEHSKKLETYRKEYIGNISHELKTPIFNIQGYIQTLLDGGLEDSQVNRKFLERADKSVERMITIIEDLQTITQFETGELEVDFETFDILALAKDVCEAMEMRAKSKNITLTVRELDKVSFLVNADRFRIRQVIANLIVNSIKYGKEGGETKILFRNNGDYIMVEVSDNGIGIDKKHLPRLFERFYRVDKSRSREQGGSGLGLSIVKHIIEAHNQNINVMSTPGVGSVFSFNLEKAI